MYPNGWNNMFGYNFPMRSGYRQMSYGQQGQSYGKRDADAEADADAWYQPYYGNNMYQNMNNMNNMNYMNYMNGMNNMNYMNNMYQSMNYMNNMNSMNNMNRPYFNSGYSF